MKKTKDYIIIDENDRIIDKFRYKATAMQEIRNLGKIHVGAKLRIVNAEEYENLEKTPPKPLEPKRKVFCDQDERWIE